MLDLSQFMGPMGGLLCLAFAMGWMANGKVMQSAINKKHEALKDERAARERAESEFKAKLLDDIARLREFKQNV